LRLFVAVWPPDDVVERLAGLDRPALDGVRWTTPDQWHVTLRFLGKVDDADADSLVEALGAALAGLPRIEATLGPAVELLNPRILSVPVTGLDDVAAAAVAATASIGRPPERRPFRGHVTLARLRDVSRPVARSLGGAPVEGRWPVTSVAVVESQLSPAGARYTTAAEVMVGA
jgi:2'-5' RNA ligase